MLQAIKLFRIRHLEQYVTQNVKNRSRIILRLWMNHCEYIVAQRFRRGQQMICLYRRIWEEQALRELLQRFRRKVNHLFLCVIVFAIIVIHPLFTSPLFRRFVYVISDRAI